MPPEDVFLGNCFSALLGIAVMMIGNSAIGTGLDNQGYKKAGASLGGILLILWFVLFPRNTNVLSLISFTTLSLGGSWIVLSFVAEVRRKRDREREARKQEEQRIRDQENRRLEQARWFTPPSVPEVPRQLPPPEPTKEDLVKKAYDHAASLESLLPLIKDEATQKAAKREINTVLRRMVFKLINPDRHDDKP